MASRTIVTLFALVALTGVKPVSSDGEATVYLSGNFTGDFDVAYKATLAPAPHNTSLSWLSILLIGKVIPGSGTSVGIASGGPRQSVTSVYTDVTYPNLNDTYKRERANCTTRCILELRGDKHTIFALVNGTELEAWPRSILRLTRPSIQLNAEVHGVGDVLQASLTPVRTIAAGRPLQHPTCAFTTRGIEPSGTRNLNFSGRNRDAPGEFVSLTTGAHGERC